MILNDTIEIARLKAAMDNEHVCHCNLMKDNEVVAHNKIIKRIVKAMDAAEANVRASYVPQEEEVVAIEEVLEEALQGSDIINLDNLTKAELYDIADNDDVDISGRSTMNKAQLKAALNQHLNGK